MVEPYRLPYFERESQLRHCRGHRTCTASDACPRVPTSRTNEWTGRSLRKYVRSDLSHDCSLLALQGEKTVDLRYWNYFKELSMVRIKESALRNMGVTDMIEVFTPLGVGAYWTVYRSGEDKAIKVRVIKPNERKKVERERRVYEMAARAGVGPHVFAWDELDDNVVVAVVRRYDSEVFRAIRAHPKFPAMLKDLERRVAAFSKETGIVNKEPFTDRNLLVNFGGDGGPRDLTVGDWGSYRLRKGHKLD